MFLFFITVLLPILIAYLSLIARGDLISPKYVILQIGVVFSLLTIDLFLLTISINIHKPLIISWRSILRMSQYLVAYWNTYLYY